MTDTLLTQREMKKAIVAALEENDVETIMTIASQNRKMLSVLVRLAYDKETLIGWRAISAVGHVSALFVRNNYEFLRETIRKLLWSLSDESGGIGWSAPEMLGEIVSADPQKMADVVPLIAEIYSIDEKVFRPGVLYALKRVAESRLEAVVPFQHLAVSGLSEYDPLAKIHSLELLMLLKGKIYKEHQHGLLDKVKDLISDNAEAWIYKNGNFMNTTVADLADKVYKSYTSAII
jgi:hypothetical protein